MKQNWHSGEIVVPRVPDKLNAILADRRFSDSARQDEDFVTSTAPGALGFVFDEARS
jgi:hypothetical protein